MKKILISENVDFARQRIDEMKAVAHQATAAVQLFNKQPMLSKIELAADCREFLSDPKKFIDENIWNNCGMTFGKIRPEPSAVAAMFAVNYSGVVTAVRNLQLSPDKLALLSFDEGAGVVTLTPEAEETIREQSKLWLTIPEQIAEYERLKPFADQLNDLCDQFGVTAPDKNGVARHLPFLRATTEGRTWKLIPNIDYIKSTIEKKKLKTA